MLKLSSSRITTALSSIAQITAMLDIPITYRHDITINSKYNVQSAVDPVGIPKLRYFGVGIRGYQNANDGIVSNPYIAKSSDFDLYTPIPIRMVPVNEDLTAEERSQYRMRVRETFNGTEYFCYYLKKITISDATISITKRQADGTAVEYTLDPANLTPSPSLTSDTTGDIAVSTTADIILSGVEFIEAINILKDGDLRYARISELGLYTGEDKNVAGVGGDGSPISYAEAVYTQLAFHECSLGTLYDNENSTYHRKFTIENGAVLRL